jgi:hypothetical protein
MILFGFTACDDCFLGMKENQHEDLGKVPAEITECIPYHDGDTVKLVCTEGTIHLFKVERWIEKHETFRDRDCIIKHIVYESDNLLLTSDTYYKEITFRIDNYHGQGLTIGKNYIMEFINKGFRIPVDDVAREHFNMFDSIQVGKQFYRDAFIIQRLKFNPDIWGDTTNYPEAMLYNYEYGILQIIFTDGSFFDRQD